MSRRVDSRDVLDLNGRTRRAFAGRVVGRYRRIGPNPWDDYELLPAEGESLRVAAGIKIQVEGSGARFRLRRCGELERLIILAIALSVLTQSEAGCRQARPSRAVCLSRHGRHGTIVVGTAMSTRVDGRMLNPLLAPRPPEATPSSQHDPPHDVPRA
jgi:hypothetical protein